ncbi:hypothetical protein ElyMa_004247100 [Elysia marginata]|uniref:Uncharacterized protein n=1 Tax=Elysia marginata TaxID=1093978 RepID=A0AAV4GUR0_9GAST|nr:hypothetical protein ElyMa_004247100 [Elysia marginata]
MGEVNLVINGVEFTTRHNDYLIVKQSSTSRELHATEPIQFPDVPPSVLEKKSIAGQTEEMRAYFKAFKEQNTTLRDYRPFFRAALCYLEGAWTLDKHIEEPFPSDRHNLDAESWEELSMFVRYAAYSGTKSPKENYAFLPTALFDFNRTTGEPIYAQWNYRIICSPIKEDLPTKYIRQVVDLKSDVPRRKVGKDNRNHRTARFILYEQDTFRFQNKGIMDRIFYDIVGKDNIPSGLSLASYGHPLLRFDSDPKVPLDTSRYSRVTELADQDAMGNNVSVLSSRTPSFQFDSLRFATTPK